MDLFSSQTEENFNLLPHDGIVIYHGRIMSQIEANQYFDALMTFVEWENDVAIMFGKRIVTKRKVAWHGDKPYEYRYSNNTKRALPWTDELKALKRLVEESSQVTYNSCLLNLYHDGSEGMAWHSDDEKDLLHHGSIASMSFGAERKFAFKHKQTKETVSLMLEHGSLLIMAGAIQDHWVHRLPPTTKISTPRANLTFRTIVD